MSEVTKAILFDSGRVLNKPATGHWFIPPDFFKYIDKKKYNSIPIKKVKSAFKKAGRYISGQNIIRNEEEEFSYFLEYYRIFSECLPELGLDEEKIECITKDLVYNHKKYEFFEDVGSVISTLSQTYKLAIVSDAWPSLENVFIRAGLRDYFTSFVISSKIGVAKPNELMYKTALEELNVTPDEAVFIDDNIKNCEGASRLGIKTILLCRNPGLYVYRKLTCRSHSVIRNLSQLNI